MKTNYNQKHLVTNASNIKQYFSPIFFRKTLKISAISIAIFCFFFSSITLNAQSVLPYTASAPGMTYYNSSSTLSNINNGNTSSSGANSYQVHPSNAIGKTITMTFSNNVNISNAIYYNRVGCCMNRIAGAQMVFKDVAGNVLFTFTFPASNGNTTTISDPLGDIVGVRSVELTGFQDNNQNFREIELLGVSVLPVELLSFEGANEEEKVNLAWVTATEINNDGFEIQHSINGINFEKIGWEKGFGNTNKTQYYEFQHINPSEVNYYRLKQIDFDGQFEYSDIRSVEIEIKNDKSIELYPNPAQNEIIINGSTELRDINIFNAMGKNITDKIEFINESEQKLILDLSMLNNGVYYIKTRTTTKKFIKQ